MTTFVIAEAASSHDGDWNKMLALVDLAAAVGASAVKFQYFGLPSLMADRRHVGQDESYRSIYHRYDVSLGHIEALSLHAHRRGIRFGCTGFVPGSFRLLVPFCDFLKVASFENGDYRLLNEAARQGKPLIVSAGMMTRWQLWRLRFWRWRQRHIWRRDVSVLHCVSSYPTPVADLNLGIIKRHNLDGFSDHSANVQTGHDAVLAGARMIESHVKLDDTDPANPDALPALGPDDYKRYVELIRLAERKLGSGEKRVLACEESMARYKAR